jgi:hypothetical protein
MAGPCSPRSRYQRISRFDQRGEDLAVSGPVQQAQQPDDGIQHLWSGLADCDAHGCGDGLGRQVAGVGLQEQLGDVGRTESHAEAEGGLPGVDDVPR